MSKETSKKSKAVEDTSFYETVAMHKKVRTYFADLEEVKNNTRDINEWSKKKKKFLAISGATESERKDIAMYFWEEINKFIPDEFPLIVKKEIQHCDKNIDTLKQELLR